MKAVPVKSLLSSHERSGQLQEPCLSLSAKQRYGIAASAAWSVLHLSGSPWLGDRWTENQANIFLEENQDGRKVLSWHPSASCILSSQTTSVEPSASDFKFLIPNGTVFALGILLIELCLDKPFAETRELVEGAQSSSLLDDYQAALSKLDEVYRLAGDSYGYAAERCVEFTFQGRDMYKNFDFSQFRQQFHDSVVAPVQATYSMFPGSFFPL